MNVRENEIIDGDKTYRNLGLVKGVFLVELVESVEGKEEQTCGLLSQLSGFEPLPLGYGVGIKPGVKMIVVRATNGTGWQLA